LKIRQKTTILQTLPFDVARVNLQRDDGTFVDFFEIQCKDWVNIIALTEDEKVVMIRQYRLGADSSVLESPGGVIEDQDGGDIINAGLRELEEETGYRCKRSSIILSINPNPAIQSNKVHFLLGFEAYLAEDRCHFPDQDEKIEVHLIKMSDVEKMLLSGEINHGLSALGLFASLKKIQKN